MSYENIIFKYYNQIKIIKDSNTYDVSATDNYNYINIKSKLYGAYGTILFY